MRGIYLSKSTHNTMLGCKAYSVCPRCQRNSEDNSELSWELVPTRRAFASYGNPEFARLLTGERIFDTICSECLTDEDHRTLERFDNDFELRNRSSDIKVIE